MKTSRQNQSEGFTLLELLVVVSIIGALVSIAVPHYVTSREKAKATACLSNRQNINMEEATYFADHDAPNLTINNRYACPSGGIYVWLISDPDHPDYPEVACSVHFAGPATLSEQPSITTTSTTSTTTTTSIDPTTTTISEQPSITTTSTTSTTTTTSIDPTTTTIPPVNNNPVSQIQSLIDYIPGLNLKKNIENQLISKLNPAVNQLNKGKTDKAMDTLNSFIEYVGEQKGKTIDEKQADELVLLANEIINMIE